MFNEKLISFLELWNWNFRMWNRKFYSRNNTILIWSILLFDFRAVLKSCHLKELSPSFIVVLKSLKNGSSVIPLIVAYRLGEM